MRLDEAHDGHAVAGGRGDLVECSEVVRHKPRLEEEVLGRVARDRQLREHAEIRPRLLGQSECSEDPIDVALEITHHGVELRERQPQVGHDESLPAPHMPPGRRVPAHWVCWATKERTIAENSPGRSR